MGIYRNFPYSNFHEFNMDWLIDKVRELTDKWIEYNNKWNDWQEMTEQDFADLKEYVENYFHNLDVDEAIIREFNNLKEDGFFDDILAEFVIKKENINCNLVGSGFIKYQERPYEANGSCYIGNGMYAIYFSDNDGDLGMLEIHNITTHEKVSEKLLNLKHGNSLTYVREENAIYSCGALSVSDTTKLIPDIDVVDVSDVYNMQIIETKTPPLPSYSVGIYSLAYDPITEYFYAICARGTTPGEYNRLIVYNKELTEIVREVILTATTPVSSQGIQMVYNGVAYLVYYNSNWRSVYAFDVNTGDIVNIYSIPQLINGYRYAGELQSLFYDEDKRDWYVVARYVGSGVSGCICYSVIECGFYKPLPYFSITNNAVNEFTTRITITVYQGRNGVTSNIHTMYCIMDAINAAKNAKVDPLILIAGEEDERKIGTCHINGFTGVISGTSSAHAAVPGDLQIFNSKVRFTYCDFTGSVTHAETGSEVGNIACFNTILTMSACTTDKRILASESILLAMNLTVNHINVLRSIVSGTTEALPANNKLTISTYMHAVTAGA